MNQTHKRTLLIACAAIAVLVRPESLFACAACYGASDSPLAQGMNWGILTLLLVVSSVLCGVIGFFVHVGRRSSAVNDAPNR